VGDPDLSQVFALAGQELGWGRVRGDWTDHARTADHLRIMLNEGIDLNCRCQLAVTIIVLFGHRPINATSDNIRE